MKKEFESGTKMVSRIGITPVGSAKYRVNRLRFHLLAYSIARKAQLVGQEGEFIIRCDDTNSTDTNRSFLDGYLDVLSSLKIRSDYSPYCLDRNGFSLFQSERGILYQPFVAQLLKAGLAFKDVSGAIFFNPREFLKRFQDFLVENTILVFDIAMGGRAINIQAPSRERNGQMGLIPFPIVRANGKYLFNLCSPIDDALLGVTHVVRDRDKLSLLAKQEMIRIALGFSELCYLHAPLLVNKEGKRFVSDEFYGEATYQSFISKGILSQGLISYLLSGMVGSSEKFYPTIDEFAIQADFARLHQSNTVFSRDVLEQHNKAALRFLPREDIRTALMEYFSIEDSEIANSFKNDPFLAETIVRMKVDLSESRRVIKNLISPEYEKLASDNVLELATILTFFIKAEDKILTGQWREFILTKGLQYSIDIGFSKKRYFQSIRYILTGKYHGHDLQTIVQYLDESGTFRDRLGMAKNMLLNCFANEDVKRRLL